MSEFGTITATVRDERGKGAARTLRRQGLIPAIIYGQGKENLSLTLDPQLLRKATDPQKQWNTFFNLTLQRDGKADEVVPCVIADVQVDTLKRNVVHIDFMRVDPDKEVVRKVAVVYSGRSAGVVKGGRMKTFRRMLRVAAKPQDIPVSVEIDITPIDSGESFRVKDVKIPNVRIAEDPEQRLVFVEMPKAKVEDKAATDAKGKDAKKPAAKK